MRHIQKRITVKNDGFCKSNKPASERVRACVARYYVKMKKKGWVPYVPHLAGNSFFYYEAIVYLYKPKNMTEAIKSCAWFWNVETGEFN